MIFESDSLKLAATDLANHISCAHLTQLNRLVALKEIKRPNWRDPALDVLIERGEAHEAAYVNHLVTSGLSVARLKGRPLDATMEAMADGVDLLVEQLVEVGRCVGMA